MSAKTASWLQDHGRLWYDDRWYRTAWIVWPQALVMLVFVLTWAQPGSVPWGKPAEGVPQKPAEQGDVSASRCASGNDYNLRATACSSRIGSGKLKGDDLAEAYYNRGSAYYFLKQSQSAMSDYNQAIAMAPSNPVYFNDRGILFRDLGDNDNAMQDFNKAIALRPNYALAYANRGYIQRSRKKLDEAIADTSTAIRLDPRSRWAYENRAFAYEDKEQWRALFDDAQKMIELSPDYRLGYEFRGHAYLEAGQYQDAIANFTKCIAMDSTAVYGYRMRGRAYYFLNQFDNAAADFQAALRIDPADETTISFFNDLKRKNPASASQSPGVQQSENYANELTDWGIPPQSELKTDVGSQTPLIIPRRPPRHHWRSREDDQYRGRHRGCSQGQQRCSPHASRSDLYAGCRRSRHVPGSHSTQARPGTRPTDLAECQPAPGVSLRRCEVLGELQRGAARHAVGISQRPLVPRRPQLMAGG